jgi:hypothetical protein
MGVPTVHAVRGWFWPLHAKPLEPAILLDTTAVLGSLAASAFALRARMPPVLACMFAAGVVGQFGLALAEGRGLAALRERAVFTGHTEFARAALENRAADLLRDYERLAVPSRLPYCAVKPPGQALVYVGLERLAQRAVPAAVPDRYPVPNLPSPRFSRLVELLTFVLPCLAALAVVPIGGLGRLLLPAPVWFLPALLFALSAPFTLVTLHLDQALYPTAAASLWWLALRGSRSDCSWAFGIGAGLLAWLMAFVSFSMLPAIALAAVFALAGAGSRRRAVSFAAAALGAALVAWLGFAAAFGYDPLLRFARATAAHAAWRSWRWELDHVAAATRMNLVEYGWWANPGLVGVWLVGVVRALRAAWRRTAAPLDLTTLAVAAVILGLACGSATFSETPRLWMFLLPLLLLTSVRTLAGPALGADAASGARSPGNGGWCLVLALQWLWTVALKATQDFH